MINIADISTGRTRLRMTGANRVTFLHGQCTNDIQRLRPGQSCYAAFLNAKGKMRGEGHVICLPDSFLLETSPGLGSALEKFIITEDVMIEDVSATLKERVVVGEAGDAARPAVAPYYGPDAVTFPHPLGTGVISATPLVPTLSAEELEVVRVEAGVPLWSVDMDENTIPVEAGLAERAISYEKGCYIGQETIARIKTYGHVNRQLVQLSLDSEQLSAKGEKIIADGREVGHVTSVAYSNRLGKVLALGYVRCEFATTGTKLRLINGTAEVLRICGE